jgi:hypothetical protein
LLRETPTNHLIPCIFGLSSGSKLRIQISMRLLLVQNLCSAYTYVSSSTVLEISNTVAFQNHDRKNLHIPRTRMVVSSVSIHVTNKLCIVMVCVVFHQKERRLSPWSACVSP